MGRNNNRSFGVISLLGLVLWVFVNYAPQRAWAENPDITEAGDILQIVLPAAAGVATLFEKDWEGTKQFTKSLGTALATTYAMKITFRKLGPGESDKYSFPSGHTTSAFSGASFIHTRYGYLWGIPAYLAAAFVGYSRVQADAHFLDDVIAGASIAMLSNWYWATPYSPQVALTPMAVKDGYGVQLNVLDTPLTNPAARSEPGVVSYPRWRFEFSLRRAYLSENKVTAPSDTGTQFSLDHFDKIDDPTTTAAVGLGISLDDRHEVNLRFAPFESQDHGYFNTPVLFQSTVFPTDTEIRSSYRLYETRIQYDYNLNPSGPWMGKVGGALSGKWATVKLQMKNGPLAAEVQKWVVLPLLHLLGGYQLTPKLLITADANWIRMAANRHFDGGISLRYQLNRHWDVGGGYRFYSTKFDAGAIENEVTYNIAFFSMGYTF
ncbi:MAG: phosphatase PAP2 family protein [Pseudomonadota bacterium]